MKLTEEERRIAIKALEQYNPSEYRDYRVRGAGDMAGLERQTARDLADKIRCNYA